MVPGGSRAEGPMEQKLQHIFIADASVVRWSSRSWTRERARAGVRAKAIVKLEARAE